MREGAHKIVIIARVALNIALGCILVAFSSKDFATGYSGFDVQFSLAVAEARLSALRGLNHGPAQSRHQNQKQHRK